jgi:NAD(P)-dependent dehydrogenase (short-subunit alcohol dehydrogenase family)
MTRSTSAWTVGGLLVSASLVANEMRRRRAIDVEGRVALITGGSRGLGLLLARELGQLGARVILAARDEAELVRAQRDLEDHEIDATIFVADVSSESEAKDIVDEAVARFGRIDILINNAGVITVGPVGHMTVKDFEDAMATHFWGPLHTMRAAVRHMREQGGGRIVNISSFGGRIGVPHLAPYCASKFALTGLSTSMRAELSRDGIMVTTVCPGLMRTGSPFNAWFKGRHREEFTWFTIADSLPVISIDARRAARQIVNALRHGDPELTITLPARLAMAIYGVAPNAVAHALSLTNRLLPAPTGLLGDESHSGWHSTSKWAPSVLTRATERSARENNEVPRHEVPVRP